jgi:hypothetical protein
MVMSPAQATDFVKVLKPTLTAAGLSTPIVCCDPTGWPAAQNYASAIASDSTANADVTIDSSHGYSGAPNSALSGAGSKHIWETEWGDLSGNNTWDPAWDDGTAASGFTWAQNIYTGITAANLSAFFYWWGADAAAFATDNGILINSSNVVSSRLWAFANYSRYIHPGAVRIGASTGDSNLQVTSYKNPDGTVSVVILNTSSSDIPLTLSLQNTGLSQNATAVPYVTNTSNNAAQEPTLTTTNGTFSSTTVTARTLITYVISNSSGGSTPTPTPTTGGTTYYHLVDRNSGLVAGVSGASTSAGANLVQWSNTGSYDQEWSLVSAGNGYYNLVNRNSGLVAGVSGASTSAGANLVQWSNTGSYDQQWSLVQTGSYYNLVNRNSGLVMGVSSASTSAGANIVQWSNTGSYDQQWSLSQV